MKRIILASAIIFLLDPSMTGAESLSSGRSKVIRHSLDCFSRDSSSRHGLSWSDVCASSDNPVASEVSSRDQMIENALKGAQGPDISVPDQPVRESSPEENSAKNSTLSVSPKTMAVTMDSEGNVFSGSTPPHSSLKNKAVVMDASGSVSVVPETVTPATLEQKAGTAGEKLQYKKVQKKPAQIKTSRAQRPPTKFSKAPIDRERMKNIELGLQVTRYHYKDAGSIPFFYSLLYPGENRVESEGYLSGIYGAYTFPLPQRRYEDPWRDFWKGSLMPTFIRTEGDVSWGKINYDSEATGERDDFDTWKLNARLLVGYHAYNQNDSFRWTPYTGFGYRRFTTETGGWVDWAVQDYKKFNKVFQYYYLPIGVETMKDVDDSWSWALKLEGDILLGGSVIYKHDEIGGTYDVTDVSTGNLVAVEMKDTHSNLRGGVGFRSSVKVVKKYDRLNFFVEPFLEYWHINKTKESPYRAHGGAKDYYSVSPDANPAWEPKSDTTELGLRMGVQF